MAIEMVERSLGQLLCRKEGENRVSTFKQALVAGGAKQILNETAFG